MNAEEAIKILKSDYYSPETGDAVDFAIDMLEKGKDVPMKPVIYKGYPEDIYVCPVCSSTYIRMKKSMLNYCGNCGQRIRKEEE